jgi:predicted Rossmann fold flavoprotein
LQEILFKTGDILSKYDVVIIGAGASGLMCATKIVDKKVAIIDTNSKVGKKIEISGGGKCNVTNINVTSNNYLGDNLFIDSCFEKFSNTDMMKYLKDKNIELQQRDHGQLFCKNSAKDLIYTLQDDTKATLLLNQTVNSITKDKNFIIHTNSTKIEATYLVIASGGASYKSIGASEIGYDIAQSFGHCIKKIAPALVGFTVQKEQFWFKNLSGISIKSKIIVEDKEFVENILFTHKGISGPAILSTSLYWSKGQIIIDFLPDIDLAKILKSGDKAINNTLPLPKRFVNEFLKSQNIDNKSIKSLTKDEKAKLMLLKEYILSPAGNFGYTKAEATKGGVDTKDIDNNFQSKIVDNLFFIGEVLDVTGELGGYNFQWAFSSGYVCGNYLNNL